MMLPLKPQTPCKAGHEASDAWNTLFINAKASVPISPPVISSFSNTKE